MEADELRAIIGANVVRLAKRRGLTLSMLADLAVMDRSGLSRSVHGHVAITTDRLCKLADALGVQPYELLLPHGRHPSRR